MHSHHQIGLINTAKSHHFPPWSICLDKLNFIIDFLDRKTKVSLLSYFETGSLIKVNDDLAILQRDEESKWDQRVKVKYIQEGRNNTSYYHLVANKKHRRKKYFKLEQYEVTIVG
jgi:hypothetical protein